MKKRARIRAASISGPVEDAAVPAIRPSAPSPWFLAAAALLILVTVAAYSPALTGGFLWDDDDNVPRPELRSLQGLGRIWSDPSTTAQYYPLFHTFLWLQHRLWGDTTVGYHVVNMALHLASAGLFGLFLSRLGLRGAWFAASLFALHPVCVESVAWITEQKNTLSTVFYLSAALAYLRFHERREKLWYGVATGLFAAALFSKTVTLSLPAALLVILWWRRGPLHWRRDILPLLPWFGLALASGLLTMRVERGLGAKGEEYSFTLAERALVAGRAVWFYAGKLLWPSDLVFIYPRFELDAKAPLAYAYPLLALALVGVLWFLRGRSRAPLATALLYIGTLFPVLGLINVYFFRYTFVADHLQYLALLAPLAGGAALLTALSDQWRPQLRLTLVSCVLATLACLTWRQSRMYRDCETLYRVTLDRNPACWLASNNLALLLTDKGQTTEAIELFQRALSQRPASAEIHNNLADALKRAGRIREAIEHYRDAVRIDPTLFAAANNLGNLLRAEGRADQAIPHLEQALRLRPSSAEAETNLGLALADLGRWQEAIRRYEAALGLHPGLAEAENNLGVALAATGRPGEAIAHYEAALRASADYAAAETNFGYALLMLGRVAEGLRHFERAAEIDPESAEAANGLGTALVAAGKPLDAIARFESALRVRPGYSKALISLSQTLLDIGRGNEAVARLEAWVASWPESPEALQALALSLMRAGRQGDAIARFQQALRLQPKNPDAHYNLGLALLRAGRRRDGITHLEEAVRLAPDHARAKALLSTQPRKEP